MSTGPHNHIVRTRAANLVTTNSQTLKITFRLVGGVVREGDARGERSLDHGLLPTTPPPEKVTPISSSNPIAQVSTT